MVSSFTQFLVEEENTIFFTFGRMNPPTIGHGKLLDKLSSVAEKHGYKVFLTKTQDSKSNPLLYEDKVKHVRKMFPKHARAVVFNKQVSTVFDAVTEIFNQGARKIVMVVGEDRVNEFQILLDKYNGKEARHGFYNFQSIKVVSAGSRDPDAEGVEGASATKQRQYATEDNFVSFAQALPETVDTKDAKVLFNDVRRGLGLSESTSNKHQVVLPQLSEVREKYVAGALFKVGDCVVVKTSGEVGVVQTLGANYVIIESGNVKYRKWLTDVELIEGNQPEWGTPESAAKAIAITPGQPTTTSKGLARYVHILSKSKKKR